MELKGILSKIPRQKVFCSAVIVAAGNSTRMGFDKLMANLSGEPVLQRTINAFEQNSNIDEIIVVTQENKLEEVAALCNAWGFSKVKKVQVGGKLRMESVLAGVCAISEKAELVAIHDGARPLVSKKLIDSCVQLAANKGACVPCFRPSDTVKKVNGKGCVVETLDRSKVALIQTPQVFNPILIKGALTSALKNRLEVTDDSAAAEAFGMKVFAIDGEKTNIKLTTPDDFHLAEYYLKG